jgi:sugar transferase (PEP-CTERM/EpsH1 system associated)
MPVSRHLLYLTHRVPFPPDKGDRIRTYHTLRFLAARYHVHLACLADEPVPSGTIRELERLCDRLAIIPLESRRRWLRAGWSLATGGTASVGAFRSRKLVEVLQSWTGETTFDVALASASSMAPYLRLPALREVPAVVDLVDVDSQKWLDYAASARPPKKWLYQREGHALRAYERDIASWARAVLLVSDAETALFRRLVPGAPVHTVTNGVNLEYFQPGNSPVREDSCVFVGALDYHPNVDAVCWFVHEVWPQVRQSRTHATFQIVGRRPTPEVHALARIPGVEVVGQVPDVRPFVGEAAVVVAPLRIARGLQNKVLEAFAMAKAVIASPAALAGLTPEAPSPALTAHSPVEWVTQLEVLFADPARRATLAAAGQAYAETHYDWDACLEALQTILSPPAKARGLADATETALTA